MRDTENNRRLVKRKKKDGGFYLVQLRLLSGHLPDPCVVLQIGALFLVCELVIQYPLR